MCSNAELTWVSTFNLRLIFDFFFFWNWAFLDWNWEKLLMSGSCHIRRVAIFVKLEIRSKRIQIGLIELRHLNSLKVSQNAKFGHRFFQLKIKRKQIFQVRRQFQHLENDMNWTIIWNLLNGSEVSISKQEKKGSP